MFDSQRGVAAHEREEAMEEALSIGQCVPTPGGVVRDLHALLVIGGVHQVQKVALRASCPGVTDAGRGSANTRECAIKVRGAGPAALRVVAESHTPRGSEKHWQKAHEGTETLPTEGDNQRAKAKRKKKD